MNITSLCPCGSKLDFKECCEKFISGKELPPTPEALMRSRYSAFSTEAWQYLVDTHHPSTREEKLLEKLLDSSDATRWHRLIVMSSAVKDQHSGKVEFVAFFTQGNNAEHVLQIHENSDFVFENGKWFYVSGEFMKPISLGRNDLCWCGSDKKHKKCHG